LPLDALALALAAAVVHALWNLLTARAGESQIAAGVALGIGAAAFAPLALLTWDVRAGVAPYAVASVALELAYLVLLATAYQRAPLSVVYPVARGTAPVLVLAISVAALDHAAAVPYLELVMAPTAVLYVAGAAVLRGPRALAAELRPSTAIAGLGMFGAYALVLAALARAAAAPVAAVRESSVVIATALAAVVLHDVGRRRWLGAVLGVAGIAAIALAG